MKKYRYNLTTNPMWMSKEIGIPLMDWCLCLTPEAMKLVEKRLIREGKKVHLDFPKSGAQCKFIYSDDKLTDCIVCLVESEDHVDNATSLVHEAVHVWQEFCKSIGEDKPSEEFEAYTIQNITTRLFHAYSHALMQREKGKA